ncbi:FkbM family methyltransferase [Frigidibacter sp. ROC022]|uniref:FkbM family methyltransferase n=1 Tax=Frigidibacter sp. ROC022 TaxID=2971796 RepID=UPI00215A4731|nr:FkbM family methyltransferase [Frigidibacter sp. ROC022]MCR8726813.1 FkbM family methyltransferase [Frigidibacter sp. ROC022]
MVWNPLAKLAKVAARTDRTGTEAPVAVAPVAAWDGEPAPAPDDRSDKAAQTAADPLPKAEAETATEADPPAAAKQKSKPKAKAKAGAKRKPKPAAKAAPSDGKVIHSLGMKFPVDRELLTRRQLRLLRENRYEENEFNAIRSQVLADDVVIELGAGMGFMSTAVALKRKVRQVHAYEANPRMIPYIREVHRLNRVEHIQLTNAALGPKSGTVNFYIRAEFPDSSMSDQEDSQLSPVVAVEEVPMLDIAAEFRRVAPTFLICDIEGAEADLLPATDLSTLRCAVVELHPQWIGSAGVKAVFDAMAAAGLTYYPRSSRNKVVTFRRDW